MVWFVRKINLRHMCKFASENLTVKGLKVDRFEGFSNRSNIDELVINSMSGCN